MISRRPTNRNLQISTAPTKAKSRDAVTFSRLIYPRGESHSDPASPLGSLTSLTLLTACSCVRLRALPVSGPDIGPRLNVKTCMHNFRRSVTGGDILSCPPSGYAPVSPLEFKSCFKIFQNVLYPMYPCTHISRSM